MLIISVEIMKIADKRERCNSKEQLGQQQMPIISVRDNENNNERDTQKKSKDKKEHKVQKLQGKGES